MTYVHVFHEPHQVLESIIFHLWVETLFGTLSYVKGENKKILTKDSDHQYTMY